MRPLILFILLGSFVGVGRAEWGEKIAQPTTQDNMGQHQFPNEFNDGTDSHGAASKELPVGKLIVDKKSQSTQFRFSQPSGQKLIEWSDETRILEVSIPIPCDHKWDKSNWFLEHEYTDEEKSCMQLLMTNCRHTVMSVEICSKCGLIRINPKDLKK